MTKLLNETVLMDDLSAEEEYISASQFEDATRTVVRTLGKNHNLDVIFAGDGAKTNGKIVTLPAQDPTKQMTKKQYAVGQGFANHETMHNLCSDMDYFTTEHERMKKEGKKLAMACSQAVEDVRIEKAAAKLYPGIPSQIASTADYVAKEFLEKYYAKDATIVDSFKRIGPIAITWRGRQRLGYNSPYIDKCLATLSPEMLSQVDKWCDLIDKLSTGANAPGDFDQPTSFKGCRDGINLSELIAREIEEVDEEEEEDEQDDEGSGGTGGGEGEDPSDKKAGGGVGATKGDLAKPDPIDPNMNTMVQQLLKEGDGAKALRPLTTALDLVATRTTKSKTVQNILNDENGLTQYAHVLSTIGGRTAVMKRKFERALLVAADAEYVSGQRTGRLDIRRKGAAIMKGHENVFRKKLDGKAIDTAVTILVDISGSMGGGNGAGLSKMNLATQVCTALATCLESTAVELEILCFNGGAVNDAHSKHVRDAYSNALEAIRHSKSKELFHRYQPLNMWVIKAFDDSLREAKVSIGGMWNMAHGDNPDGDAVLFAAKRLKQQRASKHIMLVLSDGQPAYGAISGSTHDYTKKCADYVATKLGIKLVGIGIMDESVKRYYKNYTVVRKLEDLDKSVIDNVARLILGDNFKVDNADVSGIAENYKRRCDEGWITDNQ